MEGNLYKWTNYIFGWKERYFVLKGSVLYYYLKKGEKPKGRIHLGVCSVNSENDDNKFDLDNGMNVIFIKAETKVERDEWVKALKSAKREADSKISNVNLVNFNNNLNVISDNINYNQNINNSIQIDNNDLTNSRGASVLTEDKLLLKLNLVSNGLNRIMKTNQKFENLLKSNPNSEYFKILEDYKNEYKNTHHNLEDLKKSFLKFNRDFVKLTDYFFNKDGNEMINENNNNIRDNQGLIDDNNYIELARSGDKMNRAKSNKHSTNKESRKNSNLNTSNCVLQKNEEVFYGAKEDEDVLEENHKFDMNSNNRLISISNDEEIQVKIDSLTQHKKFYDPLYNQKRHELPTKKKKLNINVWGILKDAIGRDLSKFCVPVYFNEPMSMLQKLCENFQYGALLNQAANDPNPYMRLCLVAAFCVGGYALNIYRTLKFFNPLLSETYEYVDNEMNFRYYAEQVSHHPPISACYAEGDGYTYYTNTNANSKLRMNGNLEIHPIGRTKIYFSNFNEHVSFTKPKALAKNLIIGKMHLDACGMVNVENHTTGDTCELELFEEKGNVQGRIYGEAKDESGNVRLKIEGNWLSHLDVIYPETGERKTIWKIATIDGDEEERFFFTDFVVNLNNLSDELKKNLPPSDSRFRPDQRCLEVQDYDKAGSEKHRLEEKQRSTKKEREKNKQKYKPIYFEETYDDLSGELIYVYKGGYFEDRQKRDFSKFYDIY